MSTYDTTELDPAADGEGRRTLTILLAVLGAVILAALVWFLVTPLFADDPEPVAAPVTPETKAPAEEFPEELLDDIAVETIATTYEVLLERDPFDPVVPRPASESADAETIATGGEGIVVNTDPDTGGGVQVPTDPTDPGAVLDPVQTPSPDPVTPAPAPTAPAPTGCNTGGDVITCDGRPISLVRISEVEGRRVAIVQVGSTIHEVEKGEVFAGTFRMRSVGEERVTVLYGEDEFTLQVGDRVLK